MRIPLALIEPNGWNPNEIKGEKLDQLKKDMAENGQREAITVSPYPKFYAETPDQMMPYEDPETWEGMYVICDGEHRYQVALELEWTDVEATVEELTEDEALSRFYRQQSTRGDNNPLKEAGLFSYYLEQGLTQDEVVEKLNLSSKAYLTDRLYLLKLSPKIVEALTDFKKVVEERVRERAFNDDEEKVTELIEEVCARKLSMRHYRALSTLPESKQEELFNEILDDIIDGDTISTRELEQTVKQEKERLETLKRFTDAHMNAVRPNCPQCGSPPKRFMPGTEEESFICASNPAHIWCYKLTEAEEKELLAQREREAEEQLHRQDYELIEEILSGYENREDALIPTLETLQYEFLGASRFFRRPDSDRVVNQYLEEHPYTVLAQPPEPKPAELYEAEPSEVPDREAVETREETDEEREARITRSLNEELGPALKIPPPPVADDEEEDEEPDFTPPTPVEEKPRVLRFVTSEHTAEELRDKMATWSLGKINDLGAIETIKFTGYNNNGDHVTLDYNPQYREGRLRYTVEKQEFDIFIPEYRVEDQTVISPNNTAVPEAELEEQKQRIKRFFDYIYHTDYDPWFIPYPEPVVSPEISPLPDHGRDYEHDEECLELSTAKESVPCTHPELKKAGKCNCTDCPELKEAAELEEEMLKAAAEKVAEECIENQRKTEAEEGLILCANCGKQVPPTQRCIMCGESLLPAETQETPAEDIAHGLTENEKKWLESPVKELRDMVKNLNVDEVNWLLDNETRKGARGLLTKHMETMVLPELIEAEDD